MSENKYYVTIDNRTIAENMTLEYALILVKAIFETYYNDHSMVVAIAEMDGVNDVQMDLNAAYKKPVQPVQRV